MRQAHTPPTLGDSNGRVLEQRFAANRDTEVIELDDIVLVDLMGTNTSSTRPHTD
jgi:hypothetical protein